MSGNDKTEHYINFCCNSSYWRIEREGQWRSLQKLIPDDTNLLGRYFYPSLFDLTQNPKVDAPVPAEVDNGSKYHETTVQWRGWLLWQVSRRRDTPSVSWTAHSADFAYALTASGRCSCKSNKDYNVLSFLAPNRNTAVHTFKHDTCITKRFCFCCTLCDSVSANQEARFLLVIWHELARQYIFYSKGYLLFR